MPKHTNTEGRSLKHYDTYFQRIKIFAKALGITIEFKPEESDGAFVPMRHKIRIDPDLDDSTEIAVLLHELGHAFDDALNGVFQEKSLDRAYTAMYKDRCTPKQIKAVVSCERRAWKYAEALAKRMSIPVGKWFYRTKRECLKTYQR